MKIHHIGYLVKSIEKAQNLFFLLGYKIEKKPCYDEYWDADICFLMNNFYRIELVSPRNSDLKVSGLLKKIGNSPYHICYETEHMEKCIEELRKYKYVIWEKPHKAPALGYQRTAFLISAQVGMIELLEMEKMSER